MDPKIPNPEDLGKSVAVYKMDYCLGKIGSMYADTKGNVIVQFFRTNGAVPDLLVEFQYDEKNNYWSANNEYEMIS
jgi:hypothetical protein